MSPTAFLFLLTGAFAATELGDGESNNGHIQESTGGSMTYLFHVDNTHAFKDLSVVLTTFSDWTDPDLYMSPGYEPTSQNYTWKSSAWGSDSIVIGEREVKENTDYFILVTCATYCRFRITVSYAEHLTLIDGQPQQGSLLRGHQEVFKYVVTSNETIKIRALPSTGFIKLQVSEGADSDPSTSNTLAVENTLQNGKQCEIANAVQGTTYMIAVIAVSDTDFVISTSTSDGITELQASRPTEGEVDTGHFVFYKFYVDDPSELVTIKVTAYSGDPDLYVKFNSQPTSINYDFRSELFGDESLVLSQGDRSKVSGETGWYFVGVFGYYHSVYTITVSVNNGSIVPLYNGIPQQGFVDSNQVDLYYADVPPRQDLNITIRLSPSSGDPDLFAKLCVGNLTECIFSSDELAHSDNYPVVKKSTRPFGDDVIFIRHLVDQCAVTSKPCRYLVGVIGRSSTRSVFSVVITTNNDVETVLRDGSPEHMSLMSGEERYFKFTVFNVTVDNVTFTLTPEQGNPDIYVSRTTLKPNQTTAEKYSDNGNSLSDNVKFEKGVDGETLNSTYHITVKAKSATTFSIVAKETVPSWNSTIRLFPGHSQLDTVYNFTDADYRIYSFSLHYTPETAQPIHVSLTPYTGRYTIYVANRPENLDWNKEIFYYNWCTCNASHSDQATVLNINQGDRSYRTESTYLILVQASEFSGDNSATYSITYSTGDGTVRLQEGIQFLDDVTEGTYKYYSFSVHESHEDISIKVTSFSGDPDLYLSVHSSNSRPSRENHDFASNAFGGEVMTLNWEQGLAEVCPQRDTYDADPSLCMLYISVFGYRAASYSVKVTSRKDIPELLVEGLPVSGQINETQYDYYYTLFTASAPVSVALESLNGDPDLFVNILDSTSGSLIDWSRPNKRSYMYSSQASQSNDIIHINAAELLARCPSNSCVVLTGIYCFSAYCRYSVNANQESLPSLLDGQPRNGAIQEHQYSYFSFYVNADDANILITLTSTSNGDPDLVVSKGLSARPTRENCTWTSNNFGSDHLLISPTDDHLQGAGTKGVYVIGVYGFTNTTFSLTATADAVPVVLLIPGQPQTARMGSNSSNYFYFLLENEGIASITLTPSSGTAKLFAKRAITDPYSSLPSENNYDWSPEQFNSQNKIEINSTDTNFCLYCLVVIGVFTRDSNCTYSLSVTYKTTLLTLQNGIPHKDFIEKDKWQYYSYNVPEFTDFIVAVTKFSGNPDLYIGLEKPTTQANAIWTSEKNHLVDFIRIKTSDRSFTLGSYSIGVFGVKDSSYSITAHASNSYITLVDGWPQTYSIQYKDGDHLLFWYTPNFGASRPTYCRLTPLSPDFYPSLYYTFQGWGESKPIPGPGKRDVELNAEQYDSVFAEMRFVLPSRDTGSYLIGVYAASAEGHRNEMGDFEMYCSGEDQFNLLRVGYSEFEVLTLANSTKKYEMHINEPGTLEVFVEPCVGKVSLGISTNLTKVNETDLIVSRVTDGKLVANVPHARGQYFITVSEISPSSFFEGASYQLTSRFTAADQKRVQDIVPGNDGQLSWEVVARGEVTLTWSPVTYEDGTDVDLVKDPIIYRVYYTDEPDIKMLTACEMHAGELLELVSNAIEDGKFTQKTSITGQIEVNRKFVVNVVAYLRRGEGGMLEHVVYMPTEVYLPSAHPEGVGLFIFVMIAGLLTVSLALAFVFYRKYKQVQSRLEYEMTDVRNVAGLSSESFSEDDLSSIRDNPRYTRLTAVRP